jgi:hypothetical protein
MSVISNDISDFEFVTDAIFLVSVDIDEAIKDYVLSMSAVIDEVEKFEEFREFYICLGESKGMLHEDGNQMIKRFYPMSFWVVFNCICIFMENSYSSSMPSINPNDPNQKNLAQQNRQKCIALLEKIAKGCYSMFRNEAIPKEIIKKKFSILKKKLDQLWNVYLDTEYHAETRKYIETLSKILQSAQDFESLRESQITQLNRLQKLKNATSYKREKGLGVVLMDD